MKNLPVLFLGLALLACNSNNPQSKATEEKESQGEWIQLFNGEDLDDWTVKIAKHELNDNFGNTFRVEDGLMKVNYEAYEDFDQRYGHIFYKDPFSAYKLRIEYRFVGEQAPGGEGWAFRNSGAMLHCQAPESMTKDQDFPISIEGQLLGGNGSDERSTSNLCTPGTNVVMGGELFTPHCVNSNSKTYHGDQWVTAEFIVLADSVIHHLVEGDTVLTYYQPQMGSGNVSNHDPSVKKDGELIKEGYISLQSESHPVEFRKVELYDLASYMDNPEKLKEVLRNLD